MRKQTLPMMVMGGSRYGAEQTLTLQPDETAGVDTNLMSTQPDTNKGTETALGFGNINTGAAIYRTLIKFDLTSIPADALVVSATLSLYVVTDLSSNARTLRAYRQLRAWVEAEATWNIYSTGNSWATAGGFGAADCEQTDIGSRAFTATETLNEFKDISLTPAKVQEWIDSTLTNNGILLKMDTETDDAYIASSSSGVAGARPKLVVVYRVPL